MAAWVWILIVAIAVIAVVVIVAVMLAKRRSAALRDQFGPEYERSMQDRQSRRAVESDLRNRQKEREKLTITPLPEPARMRYVEQWRQLQERFVDQPSSAVLQADELVRQVMAEEGYPVDDFNAQADLVSVDHPGVVKNYRAAHEVCERTQAQQATTEDMRSALLSYRSLFDELLAKDGDGGTPDGAGENGNPAPGYSAPQAGYPAPQPGYSAPQPGYSAPQPGYSAPPPGYSAPQPGYPGSQPGPANSGGAQN